MNRPNPRVFVSSVMTGYEEYRDAARAGIRQAGCDAVLAEHFAAQGTSSRNACIDGVQSTDALVLLLGPRYGWVAPSGRSATEEEYQEACRRHMPILVFVQDGMSTEPDQQEFVDRVEDYIHGHFRRSFQSSDDLTRFVKEAVMERDLRAVPQNLGDAEGRIREALNRRPPENQQSVWMKTAWTTLRNEEVVDPLVLTDDDFKKQVLRLGHDCEPALFRYERPKQTEAGASRFSIIQGASRGGMADEDATEVAIRGDGTLTVLQNVTGYRSGHDPNLSFVTMLRLDPNIVRDRLERAWSFAAAWWNLHDRFLRHDSLLYNVGLYDIGNRSFEDPGHYRPGHGLRHPPECPHNPLIVLNSAKRVTRSGPNSASAEISRTTRRSTPIPRMGQQHLVNRRRSCAILARPMNPKRAASRVVFKIPGSDPEVLTIAMARNGCRVCYGTLIDSPGEAQATVN